MTAPSRETREEWRREAQAGEYRHGKDCHWPMPCCCEATRILALLDALDAAEERESQWIGQLDSVRVLAERLVMRAEIYETPSEIGVEVLRILGGNS